MSATRFTSGGWIILDKPLGLGSTQAVAAVKRNLREAGYGKKVRVGHGGTLDPLATGVLPIALGEATKLCGRMLDASKTYAFTVAFGAETDTLDLEGKVIAESAVRPTRAEVDAVLPLFTGAIEQVPPAYSAIKVDGERAYDLARAGQEVVLKTRGVTIHHLAIRHAERVSAPISPAAPFEPGSEPGEGWTLSLTASEAKHVPGDEPDEDWTAAPVQSLTLEAYVSKGTYIRSLARDIARALGTVGHVTMLRRLKAGPVRDRAGDFAGQTERNRQGRGA